MYIVVDVTNAGTHIWCVVTDVYDTIKARERH